MSVLVRDPMDNIVKLFTKGADSTIEERLDPDSNEVSTINFAKDYARKSSILGLRTLFIAMKIVDEREITEFFERVEDAENNIVMRETMLDGIYSDMEKNLVLLGATAVEDKLQEGVIDTIQDLKRADIKVWMLTGDKFETAENIAASCKLIDLTNPLLYIIRLRNKTDCEILHKPEVLKELYADI